MSDLDSLGVKLVDQELLEQRITRQANQAMLAKDAELDEKRLLKSNRDLSKVLERIRLLQRRLGDARRLLQRRQLEEQIQWVEEHELEPLKIDVNQIQARLRHTREAREAPDAAASTSEQLPGESERDYLVRIGRITAFGNEKGWSVDGHSEGQGQMSHTELRVPGFAAAAAATDALDPAATDALDLAEHLHSAAEHAAERDDEYNGEAEEAEEAEEAKAEAEAEAPSSERNVDDGDEVVYQTRLKRWAEARARGRAAAAAAASGGGGGAEGAGAGIEVEGEGAVSTTSAGAEAAATSAAAGASGASGATSGAGDTAEWLLPHPTIPDAVLNPLFRLPGDIYPALFDYQKTCVQWLWELHSQQNGGIIGDEMGLGKTVQVIAFLAGLHHSGLLDKPVLVVVPATVLNQWVNEFHRWWPPLRCVILHSIGSGMGRRTADESALERELEQLTPHEGRRRFGGGDNPQVAALVERVVAHGHVLVTTYVGLRIYARHLLPVHWGYAVLDEGHKIRNPDLDILLVCKQLKTPHRVILLGTPIQNNLVELWLLFDFVFPGRLGTLPVFQQQFAVPINMGGYANALNVQVQTGYQCAVVLRDLILPYLLRRLKLDVAQDLPKKLEMVLFVKLTAVQQEMYERFLASDDLSAILRGKRNMLMGVDTLRKICNHPDLVDRDLLRHRSDYGDPAKLGKMLVLRRLLELWRHQGHRTLLFCQTRQMLDILEAFVAALGLRYLRMDGSTPITNRQQLVDTFNTDEQFHVFLLTTKVGGLGVNLTGADRVVIYDPDWNPSTDIQARERAWRLGQKKDITIYRLMTAGSIEEKIYHRQIFKTFLTNKILKDPKQRRFFKMNELQDLFTLGNQDETGTETGDLFDGLEQKFGGSVDRKLARLLKGHKNDDDFYQVAGLEGVSKLGNFAGDEEDKGDESHIMEDIFSSSGVHSALKHDEIMDSSKHELSIIEREASRVARQAAEVLRQSRKVARKNKIGTPTWTGKFGSAGKFGPKPKVKTLPSKAVASVASSPSPLSSSSILSELRLKKNDKFSFAKGAEATLVQESDKSAVVGRMVDFLNLQPSKFATSDQLIKGVHLKLANQKDMVLVRLMLTEVATWDKERKGWALRENFVQ